MPSLFEDLADPMEEVDDLALSFGTGKLKMENSLEGSFGGREALAGGQLSSEKQNQREVSSRAFIIPAYCGFTWRR